MNAFISIVHCPNHTTFALFPSLYPFPEALHLSSASLVGDRLP